MNAADRAAALVSWWVATYTQHLPAEIGQRRRAEVASDVWEQRAAGLQAATPAAVVALSILRRIAAGMPADLRWRQGQLAAARGRSLEPRERPLLRALARNWWLVLAGLIGAAEVVVGARIALGGAQPVIGTGATARTGTTTGGGVLIASAGLLLLLGIVWRRRSRSGGGVLIAAGALPAMPLWPWLVPLVVVLAMTSELVRARHLGRPGTPPPSGYQVALTLGVQVVALWLAYLILIGRLPLAAAAGRCRWTPTPRPAPRHHPPAAAASRRLTPRPNPIDQPWSSRWQSHPRPHSKASRFWHGRG